MDDRNAQVGWTEAQWNRVREEVLRAWQSVRVAGSFLSVYGSLPPSTQVVPSELLLRDGAIDGRSVAPLQEIDLPVKLTRQQILEEDLSSALLQFRRRATQLGQLEDWYVFNGTHPYEHPGDHQPSYTFLNDLRPKPLFLRAGRELIADHDVQLLGLLQRHPGALGLIEGARQVTAPGQPFAEWRPDEEELNHKTLVTVTVKAMNMLEDHGYVAPYAGVFGRRLFEVAHEPPDNSLTFPRDRLEPLIGRELLHTSAIDTVPKDHADLAEKWRSRGLLVSLAGDAVDLVIAVEATPEFRHVDHDGRYVFSVFERFTLRIKDPRAIVPLQFTFRNAAGQ
jgi:uncharacterized linocin/CFP29 family protein